MITTSEFVCAVVRELSYGGEKSVE